MKPNAIAGCRQSGMTLVELMVSIAAGVVVMFAVTNLLVGTLSGNTTNLRYTRMNQDLRSVIEAISKDLTRAGEWALAADILHLSSNNDLQLSGTTGTVTATAFDPATGDPSDVFGFPNAATALVNRKLVALMTDALGVDTRYDLTITGVTSANVITLSVPVALPASKLPAGGWIILNPFMGITVNGTQDCVLASYDLDGDGVQDANEHFGYRLSGTTIQATTTSTDCATGTWERFTDPAFLSISDFDVQQLRTATTASNQINVALDQYIVGVTGALVKEATAVRTVEQAVKVRNNAYN